MRQVRIEEFFIVFESDSLCKVIEVLFFLDVVGHTSLYFEFIGEVECKCFVSVDLKEDWVLFEVADSLGEWDSRASDRVELDIGDSVLFIRLQLIDKVS